MPLLRCVLDVALLRRGPQVLPRSQTLLVLALAASLIMNAAAAALRPPAESPWLSLAIFFIYTALFVQGVVQLKGFPERVPQTLTAVFATDALIMLPVIAVLAGAAGEPLPTSLTLASLALLVWQLTVVGHILRHALDCGTGQAVLWTLAWWFGNEFLYVTLVAV